MFNLAVEWGKIKDNPCKKVKKPEQANGRVRYLSEDEIKRLYECCKNKRLKLFITIALNTGMRKSEILGLKWSDVDLDNGFIHLEDSKSGERADIYINQTVKDALKYYPRESEEIFGVKDVKKSFHNLLEKAGITNFHIHDLRHTFASHLVMKGVPLATVKELLRHKDLSMTLRYAHLSHTHKKDALNSLGEAFDPENGINDGRDEESGEQ
jgi:integrase